MAEVLSSPANEPPGLAEEEVLRALVAGLVEHVQVEGRGEADLGHDGEAGEEPVVSSDESQTCFCSHLPLTLEPELDWIVHGEP